MTKLDDTLALPLAPHWRVDWQSLDERFAWIRAMRGVEQDPIWHAEGDVWIHTKLVCEALARNPRWRALPIARRRIGWYAVLLHDIAKPYSTQREGDRVRSRFHSPRGAIHSRRLLWSLGASPADREAVCGLVRHHQVPLHAFGGPREERRVIAASHRCRLDDLALVATADIEGRECDDKAGKLESIELFEELARELGCVDAPRPFASDHARVLYFRGKRPLDVDAFDDSECSVTLLCGLPASGKTSWRRKHKPDHPVVCLDDLREELGVDPADDQGCVRQAAIARAKTHLREHRDFVWDATNLDADRRRKLIDLFLQYRARVSIVAAETTCSDLEQRNRNRSRPVPRAVINGMLKSWVAPDTTEAHEVDFSLSIGRADAPP